MEVDTLIGADLDKAGLELGVSRATHTNTSEGIGGLPFLWRVPETDIDYRARIKAEIDRQATGGAAFGEFHKAGECEVNQGGMTLRDYFAAKALQGMLATSNRPQSDEHMFARDAYTVADAMLAERAK